MSTVKYYGGYFTCPKCGNRFHIEDAETRIVNTETTQTGYERHGNMSRTTYKSRYDNVRYCKNCNRKMNIEFAIWTAYFIVPGIIFNVILCVNFFSSPEIFGLGESFWGKMSARDGWSLAGWMIGGGIVGLTVLGILYYIIRIFLPSDIPSVEKAIKDSSLAN